MPECTGLRRTWDCPIVALCRTLAPFHQPPSPVKGGLCGMHRPGNRIGSGLRLATRSQLTDAPPPLAPALDAATAGWHTAFAQRLSGPLDLPVLRSAISAVAARQDLLRYRIVDGRGVVDRPDEVPLTVVDLTDLPGAQRAAVLDTHLATLARMAFDPTDGLCRFAVYRLDPTDHVVAFAGHRAVFDDRTRALLSADLAAAYATGGAPLPPLGATFADYLAWRGARSRWRSTQLDPAPARLELPADAPRLGAPGIHSGYATSTLDTTTSACVGDLARSLDTTAPAVLLAALGVVLARLSGHGEVGLGTPLDGPRPPAFARLIGSCVEVAALRLRPDAGTSFIDQVRRARDELSVASAPAGLGEVATAGVARLAAMPRPGRAGSPVQVLFEPVTAGPALDLAGLTSRPVPGRADQGPARHARPRGPPGRDGTRRAGGRAGVTARRPTGARGERGGPRPAGPPGGGRRAGRDRGPLAGITATAGTTEPAAAEAAAAEAAEPAA